MADLAVENYKKSVARVVERWGAKIAEPAEELVELDEQIRELQADKPLSDDQEEELADLKASYLKCRKLIEKANLELRVDLSLIQPPVKTKANESELIKLPTFIKTMIKAEGLPIGKHVSIAPSDVDFDLKAMKLKGLTFKLTWTF